ncbi:hypothetical protein P3X46_007195, partial [Hevea brasiliensis]
LKKHLTLVAFMGGFHSITASIFLGSILIPLADTMYPRKAILFNQNSHLNNLAYNFFSLTVCRTILKCSSGSSLFLEYTRMSSIKTAIN